MLIGVPAETMGADASALYARNVLDFLKLILPKVPPPPAVFGDAKKVVEDMVKSVD